MKGQLCGASPLLLILAGTADGRELAGKLAAAGYHLIASAATGYGGELLANLPGVEVHQGQLNAVSLSELITNRKIAGVLDATHPFATGITQLARKVAAQLQIPYLRWQRPPARLPDHPLIQRAADWQEAVRRLAELKVRDIFLAVGVKPLGYFLKEPLLANCHFIVKLLPVASSLEQARRLGLTPAEIVAFQGAGSEQLIEALLACYDSEVLVTKESGSEGGVAEKAGAAIKRGIPLLLVERPPETNNAVGDWASVRQWVEGLAAGKPYLRAKVCR